MGTVTGTAMGTSNSTARSGGSATRQAFLREWWPIMAGMAALYLPTLYDLFTGPWSQDEQMHGPIVLGIACWLLHRNWNQMPVPTPQANGNFAVQARWGWAPLIFGLLLYLVGRSQTIGFLEVGSVLWVLMGLLLISRGNRGLQAQWFALFFMLFMIPLPGVLVDMVTLPMKTAVSYVVENLLYLAGYPIARTGVTLQIGQYMLLVADACAGLHTLLTLEALGLLYLNLVRRDSRTRNIGLALLIVPISFTANVIRVMALTLITYHWGDAAGQGFLHRFAGMVLFLSALALIIAFDNALQHFEGLRRQRAGASV